MKSKFVVKAVNIPPSKIAEIEKRLNDWARTDNAFIVLLLDEWESLSFDLIMYEDEEEEDDDEATYRISA